MQLATSSSSHHCLGSPLANLAKRDKTVLIQVTEPVYSRWMRARSPTTRAGAYPNVLPHQIASQTLGNLPPILKPPR
jgi:hypothetical protein